MILIRLCECEKTLASPENDITESLMMFQKLQRQKNRHCKRLPNELNLAQTFPPEPSKQKMRQLLKQINAKSMTVGHMMGK